MKVKELKRIIEDGELDERLNDDSDVILVDIGYRSSNQASISEAMIAEDDRSEDDWGNEKDISVDTSNLYLLNGDTLGNRYPPSEVKSEWS
jgi:hypothetical protein